MDTVTRRRLLAAAVGFALALSGFDALAARAAVNDLLPAPESSGIDHIVVVMMENRSFDHLLGWLPGADGRQAGLHYPDVQRRLARDAPLAPDFQGCGHPDPDHSYEGGRVEYDNGACDGWLRSGPTTTTPSATTRAATCRSSAARRRTGRSATATSPRSWGRRSRTVSTCTPA